MFSIYQVLPEILELWGTNLVTDVESKNLARVAGTDHSAIPLRCVELSVSIADLDLLTIGSCWICGRRKAATA